MAGPVFGSFVGFPYMGVGSLFSHLGKWRKGPRLQIAACWITRRYQRTTRKCDILALACQNRPRISAYCSDHTKLCDPSRVKRSTESEKRGLARYAAKPKAERPVNIGGLSPHLTASTPQGAVIAALYVETGGSYYGIEGVDPWDAERDARLYDGPWPVVAHPPCQRWGAMAAVNYARWGGEHNRPGNDGGCFASALRAVRRFGGVLEHPKASRAWAAHGLLKPVGAGWHRSQCGGWVCEVWQSAYGHRANKATWLYAFGIFPPSLDWSRPVGTHQVGFQDQRGKEANKPTLRPKEAAATPTAFRDLLIDMARSAQTLAAA